LRCSHTRILHLNPIICFLSSEGSKSGKDHSSDNNTCYSSGRNTRNHLIIISYSTYNSTLLLGSNGTEVGTLDLRTGSSDVVAYTKVAIGISYNASLGNRKTSNGIITECCLADTNRTDVANFGFGEATIHYTASGNNLASGRGLAIQRGMRTSRCQGDGASIASIHSACIAIVTYGSAQGVSTGSIDVASIVSAWIEIVARRGTNHTSSHAYLARNGCASVGSSIVAACE